MLSLPFFSMMISERRVFFLQFIWYKIIFRPSSFEKKDQKYEIIWIVTVRMDDGIRYRPNKYMIGRIIMYYRLIGNRQGLLLCLCQAEGGLFDESGRDVEIPVDSCAFRTDNGFLPHGL